MVTPIKEDLVIGSAADRVLSRPEVIQPVVARTALGRLGEADDVGRVIAARLSDGFACVAGENTSGRLRAHDHKQAALRGPAWNQVIRSISLRR
jgi:hypothetical protein